MPIELNDNLIFISYRRDDSIAITGRIYDRLAQKFGKQAIFIDVDSIPLGVNFKTHIANVISNCNIVLVVIGERWLSIADSDGVPRIKAKTDFVRLEIEEALKQKKTIVPVYIHDAKLPKENDLPESIVELVDTNGINIRYDPLFHTDIDRLIRSLEKIHQDQVKNDSLTLEKRVTKVIKDEIKPVPSYHSSVIETSNNSLVDDKKEENKFITSINTLNDKPEPEWMGWPVLPEASFTELPKLPVPYENTEDKILRNIIALFLFILFTIIMCIMAYLISPFFGGVGDATMPQPYGKLIGFIFGNISSIIFCGIIFIIYDYKVNQFFADLGSGNISEYNTEFILLSIFWGAIISAIFSSLVWYFYSVERMSFIALLSTGFFIIYVGYRLHKS